LRTTEMDSNQIAFLLGKRPKATVFNDYLDQVVNKGLADYKAILQYGGKGGESLYSHVLDGVFVLETLQKPLQLKETETRVLFTAFTIHDLNKLPHQSAKQSFNKIATRENIATEIKRLGLPDFFPQWRDYLPDIESLIRGHSGHYHVGGETFFASHPVEYGLPQHRVTALTHLMRAVDIIDLSHTLNEQGRKTDFLSHLNAYLADSNLTWQYQFFSHQLTEQRGLLTNLIHNGIHDYLVETYQLIPLLFYPDGIAYLQKRGSTISIGATDQTGMAERIAGKVAELTSANFRDFISSTGHGIKVDGKCLELGIPFRKILEEIYNLVQRRKFDPTDLEEKARAKASQEFSKSKKKYPQVADLVEQRLADPERLVSFDGEQLKTAELARSYYVLLKKHFKKVMPADPWEHIYKLLDLPEERYAYYGYFNALYTRAYVIAADLHLDEATVFERLWQDGRTLTEGDQATDPRVTLFKQYLEQYAHLGEQTITNHQAVAPLAHYVSHQHKQCVHCSGPFSTDKWMTADVRSDITVQSFSNRLRGGPGEPKKYICAICQIQFMLEKLNYAEIRGEKTIYLHLFPYSFTTKPFIEALQNTIRQITQSDTALKAMNLNVRETIQEYLQSNGQVINPRFRLRTKKNKPQPYGLYLTRYSETVSNLLIMPLNPSGSNDTEQFLFALWNAMLLQRHFGMKVILSNAAVAPFSAHHLPDLYVDNIPISCQGLLGQNDYAQYVNKTEDGPLKQLWENVGHLFHLNRHTFVSEDTTPHLVRALLGHPLNIFYTTEKLLEARTRKPEQGGLQSYLFKQSLPHVETLAKNKGGKFMTQLSNALHQLAEIAWQSRIIGTSLKKNSLLFPVSEIFLKLRLLEGAIDLETLRAATIQDIFDHLERINDEYKPGRTKREAIKQFVDGWFDTILGTIYNGNPRKLLSDEKLIRSAYHFYIREQIPNKNDKSNKTEQGA